MSDLPNVAIGIGECACRAAPLGLGGRPNDTSACPLRFRQHNVDFLWRTDIVSEFDAWSTMTAEGRPEAEDHPAGLEEAHLFVWLLSRAPSKRLVEVPGPRQVGYTKCYEADALFHPEEHRASVPPNTRPTIAGG